MNASTHAPATQDTATQYECHSLETPGHKDFGAIYDCYSKIFKLEGERESRENFEAILANNSNPDVVASKAKEMWIYLKHDGKIIGAANFDIFAGSNDPQTDGTVHAIYVFVDPDFRKKGVFTQLNNEMHKAACNFVKEVNGSISENANIPIIAEQNAPLMMTPQEYLDDNKDAGIDQVRRRIVFEKEGYSTLDCRYIQPPLEEHKPPCHYLDLVAKVSPGISSIPSTVVAEHIDRFFELSFPDGTSRATTSGLEAMNASLQKPDIALLPTGRFTKLAEGLNERVVAALNPEDSATPLGDLMPMVNREFNRARGQEIRAPRPTHVARTETGQEPASQLGG